MSVFHGIQVYEIFENGNLLNAIYTNSVLLNNNKRYDIENEIARKAQYDDEGVTGIYKCRFIEVNSNKVVNCNLEIVKCGEVYEFTWDTLWKGLGLMVGINHIAVSYVKHDDAV